MELREACETKGDRKRSRLTNSTLFSAETVTILVKCKALNIA